MTTMKPISKRRWSEISVISDDNQSHQVPTTPIIPVHSSSAKASEAQASRARSADHSPSANPSKARASRERSVDHSPWVLDSDEEQTFRGNDTDNLLPVQVSPKTRVYINPATGIPSLLPNHTSVSPTDYTSLFFGPRAASIPNRVLHHHTKYARLWATIEQPTKTSNSISLWMEVYCRRTSHPNQPL